MLKNLFTIVALFLTVSHTAAQQDGCLTAVNGQYPTKTYTPTCNGIPEYITTAGWSGEYSKVRLTAGTEYAFSSSVSTDFITISDADGTEVILSGITPLVFTPESDMFVRFYIHVDDECGDDQEVRSRIIKCGSTSSEPYYGCSQEYEAGTVAYSSSIEPNYGWTANDFFVFEDSVGMYINQVKVLMYSMAGSDLDFATFDVKIFDDNDGKPGTELFSKTDLTPLSYYQSNEIYMGYLTYWVTLDLDWLQVWPDIPAEEDMRFWMVFQAHSLNNFDISWVLYPYTEGWETQPAYISLNNGQSWEKVTNFGNGDHYDGFMRIEAFCAALGVNDQHDYSFRTYPNPVTDFLKIDSSLEIKKIEIHNSTGQKVLKQSNLTTGRIDLSQLLPGVYFVRVELEGGRIETFKVMKK